jgi:hypothetical protein
LSAGAVITAAAPTAAITPDTSGARSVSSIVPIPIPLMSAENPLRGVDVVTSPGRYPAEPTPGMGEITRISDQPVRRPWGRMASVGVPVVS